MKLTLKEEKHKGFLATFCGLDGCGKTTMISMLADYLNQNGTKPILTKQPTDQFRNSKIFRTFMDKADNSNYDYLALSLAAAGDRIQHTNKIIVPKLNNGEFVISDRYFYSCLANLRARGYTDNLWIYEITHNIQKPDIPFFIDIDVPTAIKRVRQRPSEKDRYIDIDLQYKLREEYLSIASDVGGIVINSAQSIKGCFEQMIKAINERRVYV